jgi:hypothetical protein
MRPLVLILLLGCTLPDPVPTSPKERALAPGAHNSQVERERKHRHEVHSATGQGGKAPSPAETLTTALVHQRVQDWLKAHSSKGILRIQDHRTQEIVSLEMKEMLAPAWRVAGRGFFAGKGRPVQWRRTGVFTCVRFQVVGEAGQVDLDIWLGDESDNQEVTEVLIHKEPGKSGAAELYELAREDPTALP